MHLLAKEAVRSKEWLGGSSPLHSASCLLKNQKWANSKNPVEYQLRKQRADAQGGTVGRLPNVGIGVSLQNSFNGGPIPSPVSKKWTIKK